MSAAHLSLRAVLSTKVSIFMARHLPSLTSLRAFEAAARHLSFTLAAEELHVTQGAVSRQIKHLEFYLQRPLFRRLSRSLELTPEGESYFRPLREALDAMERATIRALDGNQDRVLTLSVLPTLAMRWIIPRLPKFNELHPEIEIHMVTSIKPADFNSDIDMAIRVGSPGSDSGEDVGAKIDLVMARDWSSIEAELLMPDAIVPVCTPKLAEGDPPLHTIADLSRHTLLHTGTRPRAWSDWLRAMNCGDFPVNTEPSFGHFFMTLQAAFQGKGVACLPDVLVADDLASGRLIAPFNQPLTSSGSYYMLFRKHQRDLPKLSAFRAWLRREAVSSNDGAAEAAVIRHRQQGRRGVSHITQAHSG
jgi:LysR family transcriptional regulator, glycine cleavage system transcriptional activator